MEEISSISNLIKLDKNSSKKRIIRELQEISKIVKCIEIDYSDNKLIIITISLLNDPINIYTFEIGQNYPFIPPKSIKINSIPYLSFLKINSIKTLNDIKKMYKIDCCLCCSSLCCPDNWSPSITLNHIINEIIKYKQYRKNIIYKLLLDKIKNKYLINDINLESWLF